MKNKTKNKMKNKTNSYLMEYETEYGKTGKIKLYSTTLDEAECEAERLAEDRRDICGYSVIER